MSPGEDMAIGGYFQLERSKGSGPTWLSTATPFQSARSAMAAFISKREPDAIWAPFYICGVVNDLLQASGIPIHRYHLTEGRGVPRDVDLGPADLLICVEYFGLSATAVNDAIGRFGVDRVLVDASQSFYYRPPAGCTAVYSPRKFVGVPDGGLVVTPGCLSVEEPADETASAFRYRHLLTRSSGQVEEGYGQFQESEASLKGCPPRRMSNLTQEMLNSIDFDSVASRRITNYDILIHAFLGFALQTIPRQENVVPLCFPLMGVHADHLRPKLAEHRIFAPAYWPDAGIPKSDRVANRLHRDTLYLPCDQRYGEIEMEKMIKILLGQGGIHECMITLKN